MTSASWYRKGVWYLKGQKEYARAGFEHAKPHFIEKDLDDIDCSERQFLITGANSGIGLATAMEIARRGGVLHLVCRNAETMKEARSAIIEETGNDRIFQHRLDLSKPREVASWATEFATTQDRLDVLIHNAGCMIHERTVDSDGVETNFAVNTLAVHILTEKLITLLQKSIDGRVIIVSSAGMLTVKLDSHDMSFENMQPYDGRLAYSQTKRQQIVMTLHYAQKYDNIHVSAMHPGWADTPAVRTALPEFYEAMKDQLRTPEQGADTVVWLALSEAATKHPSGLFFQDRNAVPTHLPLAWTRSTIADEQLLITKLDELLSKFSSPSANLNEDAVGYVFTVCSQLKNKDGSETMVERLSENVSEMAEHTLFEKPNAIENHDIPTLPTSDGPTIENMTNVESLHVSELDVITLDQSDINDKILNNNVDNIGSDNNINTVSKDGKSNLYSQADTSQEPLEKF